eukprot:TRINITY_DN6033_c0_g1_i1.p2 TRINITY_DN6033_c0_g1~~TRINITY_DN6033_c0_g1_i1.p2  ORF type:complete len:154 (-),score=18.51 TRINITY_DN6033_c0_g1_i1:35-496(-)
MSLGAFVQIFGLLLMYPFSSLNIIDIALILIAIGSTFSFFPILPELIERAKLVTPQVHDEIIADLCSGIYNSAFDFSEFLGPFVGGILNYYFEFQESSLIISLFCLFILIIFLVFGDGYKIFQIFKQNVQTKPSRQKNNAFIQVIKLEDEDFQ